MEGVSSQLQQLVNILSSKKIYSIIVIGTPDKSGHIFQNFDPPLEFDSSITYTCSLLTLNASSLFPNIVEGKNDTLYYSVAKTAPQSSASGSTPGATTSRTSTSTSRMFWGRRAKLAKT